MQRLRPAEYSWELTWGVGTRRCITVETLGPGRIGGTSLKGRHSLELLSTVSSAETAGVRSESDEFWTCSWCESPLDGMSATLQLV